MQKSKWEAQSTAGCQLSLSPLLPGRLPNTWKISMQWDITAKILISISFSRERTFFSRRKGKASCFCKILEYLVFLFWSFFIPFWESWFFTFHFPTCAVQWWSLRFSLPSAVLSLPDPHYKMTLFISPYHKYTLWVIQPSGRKKTMSRNEFCNLYLWKELAK